MMSEQSLISLKNDEHRFMDIQLLRTRAQTTATDCENEK